MIAASLGGGVFGCFARSCHYGLYCHCGVRLELLPIEIKEYIIEEHQIRSNRNYKH